MGKRRTPKGPTRWREAEDQSHPCNGTVPCGHVLRVHNPAGACALCGTGKSCRE